MRRLLLVSAIAAIGSGQAMAGSPSVTMNIVQSGGGSWSEDLVGSGLVSISNGNMVMNQGTPGQWITVDQVDYWQWQGDGWLWHSAQTASGKTLSIADQMAYTGQAADPWAAVAKLTSLSGHGDPDLAYGYFAQNNTASTQTYTFSVGESIVPPVGTPAQVKADVGGSVSNPTGGLTVGLVGSNTAIQEFMLSADGGLTFTNAGVDVGQAFTTSAHGTSSYGVYTATGGAPAGNWDYMKITTQFTLTPGRDVAVISGTGSITPVPEPDTYAMLLAGFGMMAFAARRRRIN